MSTTTGPPPPPATASPPPPHAAISMPDRHVSSGTRTAGIGVDQMNKTMVFRNTVLLGSVDAGRHHTASDVRVVVDCNRMNTVVSRHRREL